MLATKQAWGDGDVSVRVSAVAFGWEARDEEGSRSCVVWSLGAPDLWRLVRVCVFSFPCVHANRVE